MTLCNAPSDGYYTEMVSAALFLYMHGPIAKDDFFAYTFPKTIENAHHKPEKNPLEDYPKGIKRWTQMGIFVEL